MNSLFFIAVLLLLFNPTNGEWRAPVLKVNLTIGTPPQLLTLIADPNFEDLIIAGERCVGLPCKKRNGNRIAYFESKSSTSNDTGLELKTKFGRSTVTGRYIRDVVTVSAAKNVSLEVGVLDDGNPDFYNLQADGVIGLSLRNYYRGPNKLKSVVKALVETAKLKRVTIWINRTTSNDYRTGIVNIGGHIGTCNGEARFRYQSFGYQFNVQKVRFGSLVSHREIDARVDFQEQYIRMPSLEYKQIVKKLGISGADQQINCATLKNIKLELKIHDDYHQLDYTDFSRQEDNTYCTLLLRDNGDYYREGQGYVLGEPFLRRVCVMFDVEREIIDFTPAFEEH